MMWCVLRGNWEYNDQKEVEMIKILMKDCRTTRGKQHLI